MSASLMADVYKLRDPDLTPADRSVLLAYAYHVNYRAGGNRSWASAQTIAEETGYSPDGVSRSVSKLRSKGYLTRVGKKVFGKGTWTWIYLVTADAVAAKDPTQERNLESKVPLSGRQGSDVRSNNRDTLKPDVTETPNGVSAQTLVSEWLDHCEQRPGSRVIGQVARELKILIQDKIPGDVIRAGLIEWHRKRLHPSALASVVHTTSLGPAERASTADQRLASGAALVARLEARERLAIAE